ncbi:MAG: hypothetical protein Q4D02_07765 [Clostridia bacterium]|nr:hypothetical protein [Clostridia bacterium]
MEEKLLKLLKMANTLDKKQDKLYAQIEYCADYSRRLEISIRNKNDYSYVEKCSIMLINDSCAKLDAIIELFEEYIGNSGNETSI